MALLPETIEPIPAMFSGIVAALGRIIESAPRNDGTPTVRLSVDAGRLALDDVSLGDLSLIMKGETLPKGTRWQGTPARHLA